MQRAKEDAAEKMRAKQAAGTPNLEPPPSSFTHAVVHYFPRHRSAEHEPLISTGSPAGLLTIFSTCSRCEETGGCGYGQEIDRNSVVTRKVSGSHGPGEEFFWRAYLVGLLGSFCGAEEWGLSGVFASR